MAQGQQTIISKEGQKVRIKNSLSPSQKVLSPKGEKRAKQEFKQDADINSIMKKFQKTGAIDHVSKHQPQYGFASGQTLHEALSTVATAQSMFEELPSSLRVKFNNRPQEFLEFIQNPDNNDEAIKLGLALSTEAQANVPDETPTPPAPPAVSEGGEGAEGAP